MGKVVWAEPRNITSLSDCDFYHTMDIPNHGTVHGQWDLRGKEASYLGNITLQGKRVLEIGTASGHLCFAMERMGAEVVAYDLSDKDEWDMVPFAGHDYEEDIAREREHVRRLNNAFWMAHRAYNSHAKIAYGTVYEIPDDIGQFDIGTLCAILVHLRDPFLALQRVSAHVEETMVVTEMVPPVTDLSILAGWGWVEFLPIASKRSPTGSWWKFSPALISEFLQILGFVSTRVSFHRQLYLGREYQLYTVVGHRKGATAAQGDSRGEKSDSALPGDNERSVLEEATLQSIRFTRIVNHLLRRGIRAIPRRLRAWG